MIILCTAFANITVVINYIMIIVILMTNNNIFSFYYCNMYQSYCFYNHHFLSKHIFKKALVKNFAKKIPNLELLFEFSFVLRTVSVCFSIYCFVLQTRALDRCFHARSSYLLWVPGLLD